MIELTITQESKDSKRNDYVFITQQMFLMGYFSSKHAIAILKHDNLLIYSKLKLRI